MKRIFFILTIFAFVLTTSCKNDKKESDDMSDSKEKMDSDMKDNSDKMQENQIKKLQVALNSKSNSNATGNVVFTEEDGIVTMIAVIGGLKEGIHAIHIHEKADCSAEDGSSAGGHWNPTNAPHGRWGDAAGYHKGDIGNLQADANGNATITVTTDEWCISCGDPNKDIIGKGIIVHEGVDDFKTQPTGNAGGRVSCGGIIQ